MMTRIVCAPFAVVLFGWAKGAGPDPTLERTFAEDDECIGGTGGEACSLNALQYRSALNTSARSEAEAAVTTEMIEAALAEAARLEANADAAEANAEEARRLLSPRMRYNSSAAGLRAPLMATQYDGFSDQRHFAVSASEDGITHVFGIGDWGATLPGHYTAPNKRGPGQKCPENCGYVRGIDDRAQILVANVMKQRAGVSNPQYVLNVGDNFYWSGIIENCGGTTATGLTFRDFSEGWLGMYGDLVNKPWISCLGNHDYGGYQFNHNWPAQIGYSFVNNNWVMPARYYSKTMAHPGYTVEYFIIDTNAFDAKDPAEDPMHNICSREHNPPNAQCIAAGGPSSVDTCRSWFWDSYNQQKEWLKGKLSASTADWQIVVTHFPCGTDAGYFAFLHNALGLDLLVTGHRHDQELWANAGMLGGMTCFVTGGGGGITSEHPPSGMSSTQYGFFDLSFSKEKIVVESIVLDGHTLQSAVVYPKGKR